MASENEVINRYWIPAAYDIVLCHYMPGWNELDFRLVASDQPLFPGIVQYRGSGGSGRPQTSTYPVRGTVYGLAGEPLPDIRLVVLSNHRHQETMLNRHSEIYTGIDGQWYAELAEGDYVIKVESRKGIGYGLRYEEDGGKIKNYPRECTRKDSAMELEVKTSDNQPPSKRILVDFDHVVHKCSEGWKDGSIYDEPVEGAIEAIKKLLASGFEVAIFTVRGTTGQARNDAIADWLRSHDVPVGEKGVSVVNQKLRALAIIDDRAIRFTNWPDILSYFV